MLMITYRTTGCLNEGKSIAVALWEKEHSPEECNKAVDGEDKNNTVTDEVVSEVASKTDMDVSKGSHSNFRNTVVYGLPHITLIPPTS